MSTLSERQQPITVPKPRDRFAEQPASPRVSAMHQPAAIVRNGLAEATRARWRMILASIVATLPEWRRRIVARRELANFDARTLRDIGVDPSIVNYELRQSFWRPLRDWRHG